MVSWRKPLSARIGLEICILLVRSEDNSKPGPCATFTDPGMTNEDGPSLTGLTCMPYYSLMLQAGRASCFALTSGSHGKVKQDAFPSYTALPGLRCEALEHEFPICLSGAISLPEFCLQAHSFGPRTDIASDIIIHFVISLIRARGLLHRSSKFAHEHVFPSSINLCLKASCMVCYDIA